MDPSWLRCAVTGAPVSHSFPIGPERPSLPETGVVVRCRLSPSSMGKNSRHFYVNVGK